jgi:hypothetical protein
VGSRTSCIDSVLVYILTTEGSEGQPERLGYPELTGKLSQKSIGMGVRNMGKENMGMGVRNMEKGNMEGG